MIEPPSKRVNELGWQIQINVPAAKISEINPILERVRSPIVFDHLAHIAEPQGINHPLFSYIRGLDCDIDHKYICCSDIRDPALPRVSVD